MVVVVSGPVAGAWVVKPKYEWSVSQSVGRSVGRSAVPFAPPARPNQMTGYREVGPGRREKKTMNQALCVYRGEGRIDETGRGGRQIGKPFAFEGRPLMACAVPYRLKVSQTLSFNCPVKHTQTPKRRERSVEKTSLFHSFLTR